MAHKKLNEWFATAICGNDITSSCLYVSALTIVAAGQYAWLSLLIVSGILFLFRKIYGEVVGALPLNGGAYNVILNTSTKNNAAMAAALTILSYMATAVISASEAMHYLHHIFPSFHVGLATLALLLLFLILTIQGISESAVVALGIFVLHLSAMALLMISCGVFIIQNGLDILIQNFKLPIAGGSISSALFLGFCAAMLGISGFESSANFVEEQQRDVFPKTLRNMWIAVSVLNPLLALLAIAIMPVHAVQNHANSFLSYIGGLTGGKWLSIVISIDAVLVLSGAVLTSFVGVNGLIRRITLDRILPQFLLKENKRGSTYRILTVFFLLCISVLFVTKGDVAPLSAVYTISFLSVMVFFSIGNILLKLRRARLPRPERASPVAVLVALVAVCIALYGNVKTKPKYLVMFLQYFIPMMCLLFVMLSRKDILIFLMKTMQSITNHMRRYARLSQLFFKTSLDKLESQQFVFFSKGDDISALNKVMIYLYENEITNRVKVVSIMKEHTEPDMMFLYDFGVLDRAYPDIKMEYIVEIGEFTPEKVDELSNRWNIPKNFMFISSPGEKFSYRVEDLGGVRLVL